MTLFDRGPFRRSGALALGRPGTSVIIIAMSQRYPAVRRWGQPPFRAAVIHGGPGAAAIETTRLSRLDEADRLMAANLRRVLMEEGDVDQSFRRLVDLYTKADAYDPVTLDTETLEMQFEVNQRVWAEARRLRVSGELLACGQVVQCPVVAVHGDYDPHPADSVFLPLISVLSHFRPVLLDRCGHLPWLERHAKEHFFEILVEELAVT